MAEHLLISCEHGGNRVPARHARLFRGLDDLLESHRGWDPGALLLARELGRSLRADCVTATTTRLLVDLNRTPGHPRLFSEITARCDAETKGAILAEYYLPYWRQMERAVDSVTRKRQRMLHLSVHSFVPHLGGKTRNADVGLLYDPARHTERDFCRRLRAALKAAEPGLVVRCNYPYRGTADGLTTFLRRRHPARYYSGIELEVNQKHAAQPAREWSALRAVVKRAICDTLKDMDW